MKCLENLSLVPDECLEDLQKDIETLVLQYADIKNHCLKIFEENKDKMHVYQINRLNKILIDNDSLYGTPATIRESGGWEGAVVDLLDLSHSQETAISELFYAIEQFTLCNHTGMDIENNIYWLWRDGANWELHLDTHEDYLKMIEAQISFEETDVLLLLLKELQSIEKELK